MQILYFLAILIGPLVKVLYNLIGNYAVTMVVATLILKLLLFPLAIHQQKSTAKMSVFQPLMNEIQQKYKNDPQKQQEEMMKLQQEHGFNPMAGCLPMLLTMLVLFGFLGVVYYPVHYIFGVSDAAVREACQALGLATANATTMQTSLIQAIHNGAVIDPAIISADVVNEIKNFNTVFFGMDMCDIPGFNLSPIAIFPIVAAVTMILSYFINQKLSGMGAQMQGSMKIMIWVTNLMFVTFCFNAPVGFSLYYGVSNLFQIGQSFVTYKIYSPEKFKAQYEAELAAKRAEKKKKKTVTVEENGKTVTKEVTKGEENKLRLEMARKREVELYKDERTTPLQH
ncbi:MAG TPA: YidC/Oxa1 family membrane protein insertase [Candidatus Gemmiger excrementigallinarum]|uniref:YidC/Oxa1 family membrane protein insertase n=1 Tax=Candidatus Gemmiger excrementigallinarum TaxID=2838609 RepID=A0A9D2JB60_9FIRM|nr:YidC/Oxa1 family membrane protein insertase [Candidatus Gemmiger excrementigallinarum]